jgi:hypothetical protein
MSPTHNQHPQPFEDLTHEGLGEWVRQHQLGVTFDDFNDANLYVRPKVVQLDGKVFVPVVEVLRVCQEKGAGVIFMYTTIDC